jgi:hypothetical protein
MKRSLYIASVIALLGAVMMLVMQFTAPQPAVVDVAISGKSAAAPPRPAASESADNGLVAKGQLWETQATSARERAITTMPVRETAFTEAQSRAIGSKLSIGLSRRIPALAAEVTGRHVAQDGTSVTRLHISGKVPGTLILQANAACGFFLGQLYYDGLSVAYEFRQTDDGMTATRHELDELMCAIVKPDDRTIESKGLPPVDMAKVNLANDETVALQGDSLVANGAKAVVKGSTLPALSVNDVAIVEGNSGSSNLVFTVTLSAADTKRIITVHYATANGSATAGSDYTAKSGTLSFPKGSTSQTVSVPVLGDTAVETNETFTLTLTTPVYASIAKASGVGTITNDDNYEVLSVNNVAVAEGNSGTSNLVFTVSLSKADSLRVITVNYATANGSATAGSDYTAKSGTLTFPKGSTAQTVSVPVIGDAVIESNETFTLNLTNPVNATLANTSAVGTITNDDSPPVEDSALSVNDVTVAEGNSGTANLVFTVSLSKPDGLRVITVNYATADVSAMAGADYTAVSGTLTFPKGSTTQTVNVPIVGDTTVEADESFTLNLTSPVNATLADASGVGTITNDDVATSNVPVHNSLPGAVAVAYLDMDGQVDDSLLWSGSVINARGIDTTLTREQMSEIWQRVAEDYAPFQINVTTDESVFLAAPPNRRIRCIITPDNEWYGYVGGVAYVTSFTWPGDIACWAFSDQLGNIPSYIAESCSHEIGHTMGLSHDGRISPAESYYQGQGSGDVGWAPIMGVGYYQKLVQWSMGEYLSANNTQDDLAIITSQNGFGYRVDDHSNTSTGATPLTVSNQTCFGSGIIETRDDVDVFSFTTSGGTVTFDVLGDSISPNLDILAEIKDAGGNTVISSNPDMLTDASFSVTLTAGTYYIYVSGVGRGDYLVDGYTDYGSLGQYTISGYVP